MDCKTCKYTDKAHCKVCVALGHKPEPKPQQTPNRKTKTSIFSQTNPEMFAR